MRRRLVETPMRTHAIFWPAAVAALGLAGCAPVDEPDPAPAAAATLPALSRAAEVIGAPKEAALPAGLEGRIDAALRQVGARDLLTTNSFWTVFHGILGLGPDTATLLDPQTGRRVNALEHIRRGGHVRGLQFLPTPHGLDVRTGPQFVGQGHQDQFVAEMAQWGLPADTPFRVGGKDYTFEDFVRHTQLRASVTAGQELSWALVVIAQYRGTDARWTNTAGETLRFDDLVRYELGQPMDGAACGGTHRLFGLTWAYHLHLRSGGAREGVWKDVAERLGQCRQTARRYQNRDGSFSTRYLAGPGDARDVQLRINTTGHVLEWLALALPDDELRAGWVQEAVGALALMILDSGRAAVEGGSLYHAAHGLHIYWTRAFGRPGPDEKTVLPLPP
jgi:hypothetical protein